jgi:hypothetical protein
VAPLPPPHTGNALRFATVSGVCYFSKTDDCEGPLCDRMVLNINGGVYVVRSYSRTPSVGYLGLGGDVEETCAGEVPNLPGWPIPLDRSGSRTNGTKSGSKQEAGTKQEPGVFIDNVVALVDYLLDLSEVRATCAACSCKKGTLVRNGGECVSNPHQPFACLIHRFCVLCCCLLHCSFAAVAQPVLFPNGPPSPSSDPEQGLYPGMAIVVTGMHMLHQPDNTGDGARQVTCVVTCSAVGCVLPTDT